MTSQTFGILGSVLYLSLIVTIITLGFISILVHVEGGFTKKNVPILIRYLVMVLTISILGVISGYSGGMSRTGAVGDIIPAALGLLGGLSLYMFGAKPKSSVIISITVATFALSLIVGFNQSASIRSERDTYKVVQNACINLFMSPKTMNKESIEIANLTHGKMCRSIFHSIFASITGERIKSN